MTKRIRDDKALLRSLVDKNLENLPLTSPKVVEWKCGKCKGTWRESVKKRAEYKWCPEDDPDPRNRRAKVSHGDDEKKPAKRASPAKTPAKKLAVKGKSAPAKQATKSPPKKAVKPKKAATPPPPKKVSPVKKRGKKKPVAIPSPKKAAKGKSSKIAEADKKWLKYVNDSLPFAESLLPLYRRVLAGTATNDEYIAAIRRNPQINERMYQISQGDVDAEAILAEFAAEMTKHYEDASFAPLMQRLRNGFSHVMSPDAQREEAYIDNQALIDYTVKYLNGEVPKSEWKRSVIAYERSAFVCMIKHFAMDAFVASLAVLVPTVSKRLSRVKVNDDPDELVKYMLEELKDKRRGLVDITIETEFKDFDKSEYEVLNSNLLWEPADKVSKKR